MPSAKSEMDSNCLTPHVISTAPFFIGLDFETNLTAAKATPPSFGTYPPANGLAIRRPGFWRLALAVRRWPAAKKPPKYPLTDSCNAAKRSSRDVSCLASPPSLWRLAGLPSFICHLPRGYRPPKREATRRRLKDQRRKTYIQYP